MFGFGEYAKQKLRNKWVSNTDMKEIEQNNVLFNIEHRKEFFY